MFADVSCLNSFVNGAKIGPMDLIFLFSGSDLGLVSMYKRWYSRFIGVQILDFGLLFVHCIITTQQNSVLNQVSSIVVSCN